jgi:hypothetical protein
MKGLNGVRDGHRLELRHTQIACLGPRSVDELHRRHNRSRKALVFEMDRVVQTARRTRSSICQGLDDRVC